MTQPTESAKSLEQEAREWPTTSHLSYGPPDDGRLWRTVDVVAFAAQVEERERERIRKVVCDDCKSKL